MTLKYTPFILRKIKTVIILISTFWLSWFTFTQTLRILTKILVYDAIQNYNNSAYQQAFTLNNTLFQLQNSENITKELNLFSEQFIDNEMREESEFINHYSESVTSNLTLNQIHRNSNDNDNNDNNKNNWSSSRQNYSSQDLIQHDNFTDLQRYTSSHFLNSYKTLYWN